MEIRSDKSLTWKRTCVSSSSIKFITFVGIGWHAHKLSA